MIADRAVKAKNAGITIDFRCVSSLISFSPAFYPQLKAVLIIHFFAQKSRKNKS
jgi:hypothetical protein